jgi:2-polyprenyl-3-methyl-5-hydroxy-6-metoxy-1,4-benzoquinol methylase
VIADGVCTPSEDGIDGRRRAGSPPARVVLDGLRPVAPPPARYEFGVDLDNWNESLSIQARLVPCGSRVLEVGCATGFMSRFLEERGCEVVGLEIDPAALAEARAAGLRAYGIDLAGPGGVEELNALTGGARFDVVLLGDVIEHVRDPVALLTAARAVLRPSGSLVASVPNVAHGSLRLDLLRGQFRYTERGLLDRTHVQLFTLDAIVETFLRAGFYVEDLRRVYMHVLGTEGRVGAGELHPEAERIVMSDREAWVYQYVLRSRPTLLRSAPVAGPATGPGAARTVVIEVGPARSVPLDWDDLAPSAMGPLAIVPAADGDRVGEVASSLPPDVTTLVVPTDVTPDPAWVAALWDSFERRGRTAPQGARVVGAAGRVVHCGASDRLEPALAGLWEDHPLAVADRPGLLLPPFLCCAGSIDAGGTAWGWVVGGAKARRADAPGPADFDEAQLARLYPDAVLVLSPVAPAAMAATVRRELQGIAERTTVVVRCEDQGFLSGRATNRPAAGLGIVLFGGDLGLDASSEEERAILTLDPVELVRLFGPRAVVFLDGDQESRHAASLRLAAPHVPVLRLGHDGDGPAAGGVPTVPSLASLAATAGLPHLGSTPVDRPTRERGRAPAREGDGVEPG